ncbi:MAG: hypothetical protein A2600_04840 [Candidatus Lambdaproteobacteria bacterium RIFOXYD1_FULL_56_27]|uniref:Uncharacterized protein n=1 Tax=Candidatus Lambdaproteobacteria bacterium RIFOXYD2_FULL_56_26 TaxID=1817773 RepID=A0A1F6H423_9PROT|nr:MAG: hypothetical protein A2426_13905 [Candidatus Lambdaproteobacteria bacterium RIFOXYC1_FULL_56_13]OGH05080.1 MAG: hypothetical protein A2557_08905 [Candidatus Lambdaproteobacteria bacterium RIFOXYD2_FULL_56_26]OGH09545.1 MAG: hypothetical protein A2600_04840 [Candidatus Lambdaproteobacteria bacterium RIFOXYD1_FULL_56_27]
MGGFSLPVLLLPFPSFWRFFFGPLGQPWLGFVPVLVQHKSPPSRTKVPDPNQPVFKGSFLCFSKGASIGKGEKMT